MTKRMHADSRFDEASIFLRELEKAGIKQAAIAGGYVRDTLLGRIPSDVDVSFLGTQTWQEAALIRDKIYSTHSLSELFGSADMINVTYKYGYKTLADCFGHSFVCSIDQIFLASNGFLYDTSGHGFADIQARRFRPSHLDLDYLTTVDDYLVYAGLEAVRRVFYHKLSITAKDLEIIHQRAALYPKVPATTRQYLINRVLKKYGQDWKEAISLFEAFGFLELVSDLRNNETNNNYTSTP